MEQSQLDNSLRLSDLMAAIKRRLNLILITMATVFSIVLAVSFKLPLVYYAESTVLVEKPDIPEGIVESSATGYIIDRIEVFKKKLLTQQNLKTLAKQLVIDDDESAQLLTTLQIKEAISIDVVDVQSINTRSGRPTVSTIAVTVGFEAESPKVAQMGSNKLTDLILEAYRSEREGKAADVTQFLEDETEKLAIEVVTLEQQLAQFKQDNAQQLPSLADVNLAMYQKTDTQIDQEAETIRALELRRGAIQAQLKTLDPAMQTLSTRTQTESLVEELAVLKTKRSHAISNYSSEHPDVINMENQIAALERQIQQAVDNYDGTAELQIQQEKLNALKLKYSDGHPDVVSLKSDIAQRKKALKLPKDNSRYLTARQPSSPEVAALKSELQAANTNLAASVERKLVLEQKLKEYEERIFNSPIVEKEFLALSRAYNEKLDAYEQVKGKLLTARISENLEKDQKGERLTLLESAQLPSSPIKPNRLGLALLGGFLAFFGGICAATTAEYNDHSVRGLRGVVAVMEAPPIASIPTINESVNQGSSNLGRLIFFAVAILIGLSVWLSMGTAS